MNNPIRHPRLYAYLRSKVLNLLSITIMCSLLFCGYLHSILWPVVVASAAFAAFVGYSIWFWTRNPAQIIINHWLSNISSLFALYFLIVAAMTPANPWWYIFPAICGAIALVAGFMRLHDITFAFRIR
ncbi:MAG: hypothetical protein K2F97_01645 [Muribaculaceae bacterium]|nr:hypothetical protein [Muribaculaceae bacterium]